MLADGTSPTPSENPHSCTKRRDGGDWKNNRKVAECQHDEEEGIKAKGSDKFEFDHIHSLSESSLLFEFSTGLFFSNGFQSETDRLNAHRGAAWSGELAGGRSKTCLSQEPSRCTYGSECNDLVHN